MMVVMFFTLQHLVLEFLVSIKVLRSFTLDLMGYSLIIVLISKRLVSSVLLLLWVFLNSGRSVKVVASHTVVSLMMEGWWTSPPLHLSHCC